MIPGSNLLRRASRLIRQFPVQYYQFNSRVTNSVGQQISAFNPPVTLPASVQAVERSSYAQLGLDLQRNYVNIYVPADIIDLDRDYSGDQFTYQGALYQIETQNDWFIQDGWAAGMAVKVGYNMTPNVIQPTPN